MLISQLRLPGLPEGIVPLQAVFDPFLRVLADPNVAYVLLCLGFLGLFLELSSPGTSIPGAVGAGALILAGIGLWQLPFDWRGALFILIAFLLLFADLFVPSLGLLTLGGLALLIMGSYMLFDESQGLAVSRPLIWALTIILVVLFAVIGGFAISVLRRKPATGREGLVGSVGTVRQALDPDGIVFVYGELWQATASDSEDGVTLPIGARVPVTVLGMDGLRLLVRPSTAAEASAAGVAIIGDRRPVPATADLTTAGTSPF